jgi:cold shock CspA family protein
MLGTMLWFNLEKGHGFIQTQDGERLYVTDTGFLPGQEPAGRCRGREVTFDRHVAAADPCAVNVSFVEELRPRRARLRASRGGHAL